jgi:hypothetical protein
MYENLVALDFETYYASDYSLSLARYNTSEYVRDEQFLIHGCSFQLFGHQPYWVAGHDEALKECHALEIPLRPIVAHNMAFDGFILHEHADIHPLAYCDTLSMSRAAIGHHTKHNLDTVSQLLGIGSKTAGLEDTKGKRVLTPEELRRLGEYCNNDTYLCMEVFKALRRYIPDDEMALIDITQRMFCDPRLLVDTELAESEYELEIVNKRAATELAKTERDILMSNDKFAAFLRELGVEPPRKISPRTGKEAYAFAKTDPGFKALLTHPDEAVRYAVEARQKVKSTINETRARRLYAAGRNGQPLPILLNYAGAHTFRWSGGNKLNLQNLPRGGALRRAILAPPGHQILVLDLSQIEARITVWLARHMEILRAYAAFDDGSGEDIYKLMAAKIYFKRVTDVTKHERFIGKICVLGLGFGMGWKKLKLMLAMGFMGPPSIITDDEAYKIVQIYRSANAPIVRLWERLNVMLKHMAGAEGFFFELGPVKFMHKMIELPNGLALKYTGLRLEDDGVSYLSRYGRQSIWGGMLLENIVQALARCVIGEQMLAIHKLGYTIASMTHDEIITVVPTEMVKFAQVQQSRIMTTPPTWAPDLPLAVDGGYDVRYSK